MYIYIWRLTQKGTIFKRRFLLLYIYIYSFFNTHFSIYECIHMNKSTFQVWFFKPLENQSVNLC